MRHGSLSPSKVASHVSARFRRLRGDVCGAVIEGKSRVSFLDCGQRVFRGYGTVPIRAHYVSGASCLLIKGVKTALRTTICDCSYQRPPFS
jgi:hypothetical protein